MRLRLIPLVVLMLALPMVASACSPKLASPAAALMAASQKAKTADTVYFRMSITDSAPDDVEFDEDELLMNFDLTMEGAVDVANERLWMTAEFWDEVSEYRFVDGVAYETWDEGTWLVTEEDDQFAEDDPFSGFIFGDPLEAVGVLGGEATNVQRAGTDELDGEPVERFTGEVRNFMDDEFFNGDSTFELWIDEDGWARKLVITVDMGFASWDDNDTESTETYAFIVTLELFDYGKPVEVEAPPADKLITWDEAYGDDYFGDDDWLFEDPFDGADCYGELLSNCFATNPEVDAMAADPALCQGVDARVCLVPVGKVRADVVQAIIDFHRDTAGIEVLVLPGIPLTDADVLEETSQIVDSTLWALMEAHAGVTKYYTPSTHIAITEIDVADDPGGYAWMFGSRWGSGPFGQTHGVFSYFRMLHVEPYDGSPITDELVHERVAKYAARYTALLHLKFPMDTDIDQLNYYEMYGFGDLDSMGLEWPEGLGTCQGDEPLICIIPDGKADYGYPGYQQSLVEAAERLSEELGIRVDVATEPAGYYMPTLPNWSEEYANDLRGTVSYLLARPNVTVIGVTDDPLSQDPAVADHIDAAWPAERLAIVSASLLGDSRAFDEDERAYRLLYRAIARVHYGLPLTSEPGQLLSDDVVAPHQLDGVPLPALP